jgi:hypothetical protein
VKISDAGNDGPIPAPCRPASEMHQGTKSRGVGHQQRSGRYEDCVLASSSMEGMAPARGERGEHLVGHAECIKGWRTKHEVGSGQPASQTACTAQEEI